MQIRIPSSMHENLQVVAAIHKISVEDLVVRYIQLGLIESKGGPFNYINEEGNQIEIDLFPEEAQ